MSAQPVDEEVTIIHKEIKPEKVQDEPKEENKKQQQQHHKRNESDAHSSLMKSQSQDSIKDKVNLTDSLVVQPQQQTAVEEKKTIPQDFFYPADHSQTVHAQSPIPECITRLDGFFGFDSFKKYNIYVLDRDTIIYASGISYTLYNIFTKQKKNFYSKDKGGIAAIAVHPTKKYFAIAEKGSWPNIYIYEYPSLKLYRILRKGTEQAYSSITFSHHGDMLASVGSNPDYLLTVWDWKQQVVTLKSKAFSQEVYRVNFSKFNEHWLTTSGTGHIRFWKISETFTGLKLQGQIAKFGLIQLSDVSSFAEFEDGKVLSSSQYGKLLLWEGNLIKSVIAIDQQTPCHKGAIEYVKLLGDKIISAGQDGYIKFWDFNTINTGQSDDHFNFYLKPQKQIYFSSSIGGPAYINWIEMANDFWIVQDSMGKIWKYQLNNDKRQQILTFNSGKFNDLAISPLNNSCVTVGYDGFVRLCDYGNKRQYYSRSFTARSQSTCIDWIPFSKKNCGRMIVVGFSDGIVRFLILNQKNFTLIKAFKVHKNSIIKVKCNRQGSVLAVADKDGSIFFLSLNAIHLTDIKPYCLFQTGFKINDLTWDRKGEKILLGCQDGKIHEITAPIESQCDNSQTYLKPFNVRSYTIKMMESQKPNKEEMELQLLLKKTKGANVDDVVVDEQWEPAPILNAIYFDVDCTKVLCSVDGKYLGNYYIVDFNKQRPIGAIPCEKLKTSYMQLLQSQDLLLIGFRRGCWEMRHKLANSYYLKKQSYDQNYGIVKKVALNIENTAIISASEDGTMTSYKIDSSSFLKGVRGQTIEQVQVTIPSVILGISQTTFSDKIDLPADKIEQDIIDNSIYCLQDQKLKAEQDMKLSEADKIKNKKLKKIKQLQTLFKDIVQANNKQTDYLAKLSPQQLVIDPQYTQAFQKRIQDEVQQTKKVLLWDEQFAKLSQQRLENYFINQLESLKFSVKGINSNVVVSSFKIKKLSKYILNQIQAIEKIIEQQKSVDTNTRKDRTTSSFAQSKALMDMVKAKDTKKGKQENAEVSNKIKQAEAQFEKQLAHAKATIGDYKLKSAPSYVVPQNQRLNVSKKKKHLFLHYQYLFMEKKEFNDRLRNLKNKKLALINNLSTINEKIQAINQELGENQQPFNIELDETIQTVAEQIKISQTDIADYVLQKQREKQASKKGGGMGGMGGMTSQAPKEQKKVQQIIDKQSKVQAPKQQRLSAVIKPRGNLKIKKTALEQQLRQIRKIKLLAEKERIKKELQKKINEFDEQLESMRQAKYQLQNDLTLVQMKLLTFAQEFIIFRDMDVEDNKLITILNNYGNEKISMEDTFVKLTNEINDIQSVNEDVRKKYDDEKKIFKEFVYPDDQQMRERIIRYYKIRQRKRMSKLKKQAQMQEKAKESQNEDSEENDSQQDSEEEQQSQQEFEDQEQKPDITVIQNDHKNFERIRKICEYDEKIQENSKKKSELEKQRNQINNKMKNIQSQLAKAQKQLKQYQKKKLIKVNQLLVSFPVKFSQNEYLVKISNQSKMHEEINNSILFTRQAFKRLSDRIQQLKKQKIQIEKKQKNLKKKETKLEQAVNKASIQIQSKKKQYEEKQLLKFGSTFEMQRLQELEPTNQVLQMREIFKKQQKEVSSKIQAIKQQLQLKKRQLLETKRQNTKVITEITELGERQNDLKKKLDSTNKQLFKNYDVSKKDQLEKERQNLKDLIKFLSKEIEDLKTQIGLFKRKGGHIYTMVTSNRRNFT